MRLVDAEVYHPGDGSACTCNRDIDSLMPIFVGRNCDNEYLFFRSVGMT